MIILKKQTTKVSYNMITNYEAYSNAYRVFYSSGDFTDIYLNSDSGKVIWREKINTINKVKHEGVIIGEDINGRAIIAHNHYHFGSVKLDSLHGFSKGKQVYYSDKQCVNPPKRVIKNILNQAIEARLYEVLTNNCQHATNKACSNKSKSEDINKWLGGLALTGVVFGVISAFASSK